jgi:hypothetical protein
VDFASLAHTLVKGGVRPRDVQFGAYFRENRGYFESAKGKQLLTGETTELCHRILPTCHKYVVEANRILNYMTNASHLVMSASTPTVTFVDRSVVCYGCGG